MRINKRQLFIFTLLICFFSASPAWPAGKKILKQPSYERNKIYAKDYADVWDAILKSIPRVGFFWMFKEEKAAFVEGAAPQMQADKDSGLVSFFLIADYRVKQDMRVVKILIEREGNKVDVSINCPDSSGVIEEYLFSRIDRYLGLVKDDYRKELLNAGKNKDK